MLNGCTKINFAPRQKQKEKARTNDTPTTTQIDGEEK